jgi:hypothetical protein
MATVNSASSRRGTWLVIGLLTLATVLVIISRVYRTPPPQDLQAVLQQQGIPAARQGIDLSREGKKLLAVEEQREMDTLYAEALQTLTPEERQYFWTLAQKGSAASDREITESTSLMQKALRSLSQEKLARLLALIEKAVRLQLAQQKSTED